MWRAGPAGLRESPPSSRAGARPNRPKLDLRALRLGRPSRRRRTPRRVCKDSGLTCECPPAAGYPHGLPPGAPALRSPVPSKEHGLDPRAFSGQKRPTLVQVHELAVKRPAVERIAPIVWTEDNPERAPFGNAAVDGSDDRLHPRKTDGHGLCAAHRPDRRRACQTGWLSLVEREVLVRAQIESDVDPGRPLECAERDDRDRGKGNEKTCVGFAHVDAAVPEPPLEQPQRRRTGDQDRDERYEARGTVEDRPEP